MKVPVMDTADSLSVENGTAVDVRVFKFSYYH